MKRKWKPTKIVTQFDVINTEEPTPCIIDCNAPSNGYVFIGFTKTGSRVFEEPKYKMVFVEGEGNVVYVGELTTPEGLVIDFNPLE